MELEESYSFTSDYTTKLQSSKQYDIGIHIDQCYRRDSSEINPLTYGQFICDKAGQNIQGEKKVTISGVRKTAAKCKRMKLENSLTLHAKINSKCIKDLNVRPDTIKLPEDNLSRTFFDINHHNIFLDHYPRLMEIKIKISK